MLWLLHRLLMLLLTAATCAPLGPCDEHLRGELLQGLGEVLAGLGQGPRVQLWFLGQRRPGGGRVVRQRRVR